MATDLDARQLRALTAVLDHGGFTHAARALGVSQSTVSEAIASLERALGAEVLVRGRRPTLTPAGEALVPHARRVLAALDDAHAAVAEATSTAKATIVIGTNESLAAYVLPPILAAMRRAWPGTRYQVSTLLCTEVRAGVAEGRVDLGLVLEPQALLGDEETTLLGTGRLVPFARPDHPLAGRRADAAALAGHDVYLSDAAGNFHTLLRRYLETAGFRADRLLSTGSVEGVKQSVAVEPRAVGVLPAHAMRAELRARTAVELRLDPPLPTISLKALWRRGTEPSARTRELVERLREVPLAGSAAT